MSRSLNASMAAISSGVARPAVSSITETRYCISDHLLWFGAPVGGRSPLLQTPRALTDDHRDDEQVHLVRQVVLEQPPDQFAAAVHLQLTPLAWPSARRW